jgi:hypothetical protein
MNTVTTFWSNDPTILLNKDYITQIWPTQQMGFEEKMNAITRLVIILSILGFLFTNNFNLLVIGIITIALIYSIYRLRKQNIITSLKKKEGFKVKVNENENPTMVSIQNPVTLEKMLKSDYYPVTKKNPFGNVLLTDIMDQPDRNLAAPSFNPEVYEEIQNAVKKQTQMLNPGIVNTNKQLYGDLKDNYDLDNAMQRFYTTANTRVNSDQSAYAQYLYGSMYSAKESTPEGAWMRVKDNFLWINP